ncbi:Sugar transferase involved in LPS biosynthesis (colanic, teichoic acid) [Paracoccus isoporae]|uniref:Sugar transferase involved in LPS biosynthesis (Colanic, teichoic acid) n=1 Tax=Paracoccus isoporae TaxID=591205 RepID=A0A1G6XG39_9RHOB|nr:sugar transferase [Paracoccus isoporae]SDD77178.1 Sugar transferase involved in LPS biosynthesis (colanic, teichoic acid) [Paracoccus isoporae]
MKGFSGYRIGFQPGNELFYRSYNFLLAAICLVAFLPLLLLISLLLFCTQGPEIFYRGARLGRDQRPFHILKFRTLCSRRAREVTRDRTLPKDAGIETPLGGMLRETRLDELPQLFNVLRGDMNICGPRPVRAEIAEIERHRIPDYDRRFSVRPGLIGPTQAYFSHGTSKRVRARMNNRLVARPVSLLAELGLLGRVASSMLLRILGRVGGWTIRRAPQARPDMWLVSRGGQRLCLVEKIGLRRITAPGLPDGMIGETATLYIRLRGGGLRSARIVMSGPNGSGEYSYTAESEFGEFVIERYALGLVVVRPELSVAAPQTVRPAMLERVGA